MNKQKRELLKFAKQTYKEGNVICLLYEKTMPTGEIATTPSTYKYFEKEVKRAIECNINFGLRIIERTPKHLIIKYLEAYQLTSGEYLDKDDAEELDKIIKDLKIGGQL